MAVFYNIMFYGGLTLAILLAIVAVVMFFVLKIPAAIGDVTGSTAKKKIEEIREKGYESVQGVGAAKKDAIKSTSTKISVRDVQSSTSRQAEKGRENYEKAVADLNRKKKQEDYLKEIHEDATDVLREDETELPTDVLREEEATDVLRENEASMGESLYGGFDEATDVLREDDEATDVLRSEDDEATDVLRSEDDEATDVLRSEDDEATDVLRSEDDEATDVLRSEDDEATDVLRSEDDEATDVLRSEDDEATDILRSETGYVSAAGATDVGSDSDTGVSRKKASSVTMIKDIVVVHSEEKI
jgi:hypothetical protein